MVMIIIMFYFIIVYMLIYGRIVFNFSVWDSLIVIMLVGVFNFIWLFIGGVIFDWIGCCVVLMGIMLLVLIIIWFVM